MSRTPIQVVVDALERHGRRLKHNGDQVDAQCPAHDDQSPSLSIRYDRPAGKVLLNCHTGCTPDAVLAALGLTWADLFDPVEDDRSSRMRMLRPDIVATYDYTDETGAVLYQKVRLHPKDFRVRRPDGRGGWQWSIGDAPRVLYRLPELHAAVGAGRPVFLVEGEKDADRVTAQLGLAATCNFEGAASGDQRPKWRPEYTEQLRDARVLIVADNDPPGFAHARAVAAALDGVAAEARVLRPALDTAKADMTDHLDAGYSVEDLVPVLLTPPTPDPRAGSSPAVVEPYEVPPLASAAGRLVLPALPEEFWESRVVHRHIRQAAHARVQVPDIVLYSFLARLAALCSHHLRIYTGIGGPASTVFYAALMGYSGDGKTEGSKVAAELLPAPDWLDFEDALPLGSGEGIAEAYMGTVPMEVPGKGGRTRIERVRKQVRHNALFFVDEGQTLIKSMERAGATVGGMMRSAWSGTTIGQKNASDDRTRVVRAGTYSLGLVIGFQPDVAQPLLADSHTGMPQRFCWSTSYDPTIPDERVDWPGGLPWDPEVIRAVGPTAIRVAPEITDELHRDALARRRGEVVVDELDGQMPLMRVKLAALLALLDSRREITVDDWVLSELVWDTSCAVRGELVKHAQIQRVQEESARTQMWVDRRVAEAVAVSGVEQSVARVARTLADRVHEAGGMTQGAAYRSLAGRDRRHGRGLYDAAVEYGAAQDWIQVGDAGLVPGGARPVVGRGPGGHRI